MGLHLLVQSVMIPPEVLGVIVTLEKGWGSEMIEGFEVKFYGILEKRNPHITNTVKFQVTNCLAGNPYLTQHLIMECLAESLYELTTDREIIFYITAISGEAILRQSVIG